MEKQTNQKQSFTVLKGHYAPTLLQSITTSYGSHSQSENGHTNAKTNERPENYMHPYYLTRGITIES